MSAALVLASLALVACGSAPVQPTAADDLWESQDPALLKGAAYGRVKSVVRTSVRVRPNPTGFPGRPTPRVLDAVVAETLAPVVGFLQAETRFMHIVEQEDGHTFMEASIYSFPLGSCVSAGANMTRYIGRMAFSNRCAAAK